MGTWWTGGRGEAGDRTIEQQMTGLDQLWPRVAGKAVADLGCAEGAISLECARRGAAYVRGWERRHHAVDEVNRLARKESLDVVAYCADVDGGPVFSAERYDVILLLAILHKLKEPVLTLSRVIEHAAEDRCTIVLRTRARDWPVLHDARSGFHPQDLRFVMYDTEFTLVHEADGPSVDGQPPEWVGIFERSIA